MDQESRFWSNVDIGNNDECWNWARASSRGYGDTFIDGKHESSHRAAWRFTYGSIPEGLCVLHKCDNRLCCNPTHLFIGTYQDNSDDKCSKGRQSKGDYPISSKLKDQDVYDIKDMRIAGLTIREIAGIKGVGKSVVCGILNGTRWKHVV